MRVFSCAICGVPVEKNDAYCPCCGEKQRPGNRRVFPANNSIAQVLNNWLCEHPQLAEVRILPADGGAEVVYEQLACDNLYQYRLFSADAPEARFAKQTLAGIPGLEGYVLCRMERRSAANI